MEYLNSGIYMILNKINNKRYIGQAVDLKRREREHFFGKKRTNPLLRNSMKKYGYKNFEFIVLEYTKPNKKELTDTEQKWLDYYKDNNKWERLYNLCPFAETNLGLKSTETAKQNISKALTGKKKSEEHVEKIRQRMLKTGINPIMKEKAKLKTQIPVVQIDIDTNKIINEFESIKQAANYMNIKSGHLISKSAKGKIKDAYGYIWRFKNSKDIDKNNEVAKKQSLTTKGIKRARTQANINASLKLCKKIKMVDINTNEELKIFNSIVEAYKFLNLKNGNIVKVLKGKYKKAHGYRWEYA